MRGFLYYIVGDAFDASDDLWNLRNNLHVADRYAGFASAVELLLDFAKEGYSSDRHRHMLQNTATENLMLFQDAGVRLGFNVPGSGRAPTPDIAFLGAEFYDTDPGNLTDRGRTSFVTAMRSRLARGRMEIWTFAAPLR